MKILFSPPIVNFELAIFYLQKRKICCGLFYFFNGLKIFLGL